MICVAGNDLAPSYKVYLNAEQMVRVKLCCGGCMICVAADDLSLSYVAYLNAEQMVGVKL